MTAIHAGDLNAVRALLAHGANANAKQPGFEATALMVAEWENQPAIAKLLLENIAEVNVATVKGAKPARRSAGAGGGSHGVGIIRGGLPESGQQNPAAGAMTPLLYAARDGRLLMDKGADPNRCAPSGS